MAEATDVITLADAKAELRLEHARFDEDLALLISAVSQRLDELCGPVIIRTVTDTLSGYRPLLLLTAAPVVSITSVTEYAGTTPTVLTSQTNVAQTANDYLLLGESLERTSYGYRVPWAWGASNIVVVYQAGRFATTADVSAKFRKAARLLVRHWWAHEARPGTQTFPDDADIMARYAVPNAVVQLLGNDIVDTVSIG